MKITKRILQKLSGSCGKPTKIEKKVKIPNPLFKDEVKAKKIVKKEKKPYYSPYETCPFCHTTLPIIKGERDTLLAKRQTWCNECGASWVQECPACKHPTWLSKEGIYKHPYHGCGYTNKGDKKNG